MHFPRQLSSFTKTNLSLTINLYATYSGYSKSRYRIFDRGLVSVAAFSMS